MNVIFRLLKTIYNFFFVRKLEENKKEEEVLAEIVHPLKFKYLPDNNEEESLRTQEESLGLFKKFLNAERIKQEEISRKTRDHIIQRKILETNDEGLILHLTSNMFLAKDIQLAIATNKDLDIKIKTSLARNIILTFESQEILAQSPDPEVRRMLVRWQRPTNPTIGSLLTKDPDLEVRKSLAMNVGEDIKFENVISFRGKKNSLQTILVEDPDMEVRACLALNKSLIFDAQMLLAKKSLYLKEWAVIKNLSENESLKEESAEYILDELQNFRPSFQTASISRELKKKIATKKPASK